MIGNDIRIHTMNTCETCKRPIEDDQIFCSIHLCEYLDYLGRAVNENVKIST